MQDKIEKPFNVFLVDDDLIYLQVLEKSILELSTRKVKIRKFSQAKLCLSALNEKPDVIILDYYLNKELKSENGLDVLKKIRRQNKNAKIIMLSSQDKLSVAVNSIKFGAYDYVVKGDAAPVKIQNSINNIIHYQTVQGQVQNQKFWIRLMGSACIALLVALITYSFYKL